jgi:hypothetical protein
MRTHEEQSSIGLNDVASVLASKLDKAAAVAGAADD